MKLTPDVVNIWVELMIKEAKEERPGVVELDFDKFYKEITEWLVQAVNKQTRNMTLLELLEVNCRLKERVGKVCDFPVLWNGALGIAFNLVNDQETRRINKEDLE